MNGIEVCEALMLLILPTWTAASPPVMTARSVLSEIKSKGAKPVLLRIFSDTALEDALSRGIETGTRDWLKVAVELKPASDAASALSLDISVARALPQAPERVLRLIGKDFSLDAICTSPFIEPEPGVAEEYERRAVKALARVKSSDLKSRRDACALAIKKGLKAQDSAQGSAGESR